MYNRVPNGAPISPAEPLGSDTYDLIVIGAGMAGIAAANKCAAEGWRVAIVDSLPSGGTCALRGCDPKKILRRGAEIIDSARLMRGKGIDDAGLAMNWSDLMAHKHGFTGPVPERMESGLDRAGVDTLHGHARFVGTHQIDIDGTRHQAERFLIATGARPRPLNFPGCEHLIDSTDFLDLDVLPARILFVGGGFISFEFAHLVARAGSTAVIIDRGARPLKSFDPDLVELLLERGREVGIDLRRSTHITAVERTNETYRVTLEHAGVNEIVEVDVEVQRGTCLRPCRTGLGSSRCGMERAGGACGGSPSEHVEPCSVGRRRLRRHRRNASDANRGRRGQGCRVQYDHGHHHHA